MFYALYLRKNRFIRSAFTSLEDTGVFLRQVKDEGCIPLGSLSLFGTLYIHAEFDNGKEYYTLAIIGLVKANMAAYCIMSTVSI